MNSSKKIPTQQRWFRPVTDDEKITMLVDHAEPFKRMRFVTKSYYEVSFIFPYPAAELPVVVIRDDCNYRPSAKSVTNNLENVINEISAAYNIDLHNADIIYCDSSSAWDGVSAKRNFNQNKWPFSYHVDWIPISDEKIRRGPVAAAALFVHRKNKNKDV